MLVLLVCLAASVLAPLESGPALSIDAPAGRPRD